MHLERSLKTFYRSGPACAPPGIISRVNMYIAGFCRFLPSSPPSTRYIHGGTFRHIAAVNLRVFEREHGNVFERKQFAFPLEKCAGKMYEILVIGF